jgi:ferritin-like metal-binding protein YciE
LGEHEAASLLEETLNEEKDADAELSELAESLINIEASGMDDEGGMRSGSGTMREY